MKCKCGKTATTKVVGLIYEFTDYVCDEHLIEYKNSDPYEKFEFIKMSDKKYCSVCGVLLEKKAYAYGVCEFCLIHFGDPDKERYQEEQQVML